MPSPELSIIVPALNEQDNVGPLVDEVRATFADRAELIIVDDGSTDQTPKMLADLAARTPWLRVLRRDEARGQSAAMAAGVESATAPLIAFLDADLQNDPAELRGMLQMLREQDLDLVQGDRSATRADSVGRKWASGIGRFARRVIIGDAVRDTGCSARVMKAEYAKRLPLHFKGMHRFIPACTYMMGGRIGEYPVNHRARHSGETKYGIGVFSRGVAGLMDLLAVRWMGKRWRDAAAREIERQPS